LTLAASSLVLGAGIAQSKEGGGGEPLDAKGASTVVRGLAEVRDTYAAGKAGTIFVFEEFHTSRIAQLHIAAALNRLHDRGVRTVALEGAEAGKRIDGSWFQGAAKPGDSKTEDVAVRMLAEGEINAAEMMALLFPDEQVYGIENMDEYAVQLDAKGSPEVSYLLSIVQAQLTPQQIARANELVGSGKNKEVLDYLMKANPWAEKQFAALKKKDINVEQIVDRMKTVRAKADSVRAQVPEQTRQDFDRAMRFWEAGVKRSATMVANTAKMAQAADNHAVAMIIGGAHSAGVVKLLKQRGFSYVLLRPDGYDTETGSLSMAAFERKSAGQWHHVAPGTLGKVLSPHHKPPPVIGTATAKSYASALLASTIVAEAARDGKKVPDDIRADLANLPGCKVDLASVRRDGYDTTFRMMVTASDGGEKAIWARVGTTAGSTQTRTLEQKLMTAAGGIGRGDGGGGIRPPDDKTTASADEPGSSGKRGKGGKDEKENQASKEGKNKEKEDRDDGIGDKRVEGVTVTRLNSRALAVFGEERTEVDRIGRISG
jgi:hypothetical protein